MIICDCICQHDKDKYNKNKESKVMNDMINVITNNTEEKVIDSREVAEMMGKKHSDLMKDIQGSGKNLGIIPVLTKGDFVVLEYFIESSYIDTKGEKRKCYLCTPNGVKLILDKTRDIQRKQKLYKWWIDNSDVTQINIPNMILDNFEFIFINKLEESLKPFNIKGIKQYSILTYRIDYYIPTLNIAIEYDENEHKHYSYKAQEGRQIKIERELGCKFIRVSNQHSDEYNIGLVIKKIMEIK